MKSIKTTIGGALGTLGTSLSGVASISAMSQFNGSGNITKFTMACVATGTLLSCLGKFFTALFAADNSEVQRRLVDHDAQIAQIKEDTTHTQKPK